MLAISGIRQTGANVLFREIGELAQDFRVRHSAGQVFEHIINGNSQPPDAGLAASFAGFDRDNVRVRLVSTLCEKPSLGNWKRSRYPTARIPG